MKIIIEGSIIETEFIYKIGEVHWNANNGCSYFQIYFLNDNVHEIKGNRFSKYMPDGMDYPVASDYSEMEYARAAEVAKKISMERCEEARMALLKFLRHSAQSSIPTIKIL